MQRFEEMRMFRCMHECMLLIWNIDMEESSNMVLSCPWKNQEYIDNVVWEILG